MANLILWIPQPTVARTVAFFGVVHISGATPHSNISVNLRQVHGAGAYHSASNVMADAHGNANAPFPGIVLAGVFGGFDTAALLATATGNPKDTFDSDAQSVEVV
jgi:hypothetical protein